MPDFENQNNEIIGTIIDDKNNVAAKLQNYTNSIGMAFLTPSYETTYMLVLNNQERYSLPEVSNKGVTLNVNNLDPYATNIRVVASNNSRKSKPMLKGYSNGVLQFSQKLQFKAKSFIDIDLDKTNIPSGILELRIINELGEIEASRPLWVDKNTLVISLDAQNEDSLDSHTIKVTDHLENPVVSNITLSGIILEREAAFTLKTENGSTAAQKKNTFKKDLELLASYAINKFPINENFNPVYEIQNTLQLKGRVFNLENKILRNTPFK